MDMDMDQQLQMENASVSQHNSQSNHEGGEQEAGKLQLMSPPEDSIEIEIQGQVTNEQDAENLIKDWIKDPSNKEFNDKHAFVNEWQHNQQQNGILAYFKKQDTGLNDMSNMPGGKRASPLRNGNSYSNYMNMRTTSYTTGVPGPVPPPADLGATQGLWRSYYAQQRDASRERDLAANAERYRRSYIERGASGSPVRSHSPARPGYPLSPPHPMVEIARYAPAFSHYEQHREQREQREHMEHQKIQQEHQKQFEITQISQNIRERIIATYRAEIESHKLSERNFATLRAQIEDLQRRRDAYEQSVTVLKGDFEAQIQSQNSVINSCQNELEMLKNQNADKAKEGIEVSEQIQAIRTEINARDQEIRDLSAQIHTTISSNQGLEREIESLKGAINEQQEVRTRQQGTIYQQNGALSKWEQECFAQSSRISVLEKERNQLIDRTGALNEQLNVRTQNCDECQGRIHAAQTDISTLKSNIHGLDIEINNMERANGMLVEDQKHKLSKNSHEYNAAHELTSSLQGMEAKYYSLEVDERSKNTDLEAVNYSNQALMDRNLDLKAEYEALQKHSLLLTQQNKDLQRELDSFVETDDIVRRNLDRKEKVSQIRYTAGHVVHDSSVMVARSRSPLRGGSPLREVIEHEVRSRSPYAHYVHPPPMGPPMGMGGPMPLRRDYSPARKENVTSYSYAGKGSFLGAGTGRAGSPFREGGDPVQR